MPQRQTIRDLVNIPEYIESAMPPEMLAAGLRGLVDSGVLDQGAGRDLPTGADEVLVADIYKAMVRARSRDAAVQVTLPA